MQIHTFEVSAMLTNETYYNIQNELKTRNRDKWKALKNGMQYWGLSDKGILINFHQVKKKGFYSYYIIYRISARRVMENDNFVGLFNIKNYSALEDEVNMILKDACVNLPKLNKCNLKRLDFCVNARLDNQEQVKAYIDVNIEEIKEHVLEIDGIADVHHVHIWSLDGYNNYATMHVVTDREPCDVKKEIREELSEHNICHVTLELEKTDEDCHDECCHIGHTHSGGHHHHHHHHHHH